MGPTLRQTLDLALQQHQSGQFHEAESNYRAVLAINPNLPDALHLLGLIFDQTGRHEQALEPILKAISLRPHTAEFHSSLAAVYLSLEKIDASIASAQQAVQLKPQLPQAWLNLANALAKSQRHGDALNCYQQAIARKPNYADAYLGIGNVFAELKQTDQAIAAYQQAIAFAPQLADAHFNLGNVLQASEQFDAALDAFSRCLAIKPDHLGAINNYACTLSSARRTEEAYAYFHQAIAAHPHVAKLHSNLGDLYSGNNRLDEAMACYRQALVIQPNLHEARFNLAIVLLAIGDYPNGWIDYESRWLCKRFPSPRRFTDKPLWRGEPLNGQRILIHFEQGFGDTLQFIRYIPMVTQRGGRVLFLVQPALLRLLQNIPDVQVTAGNVAPDQYDLQCPTWSLPLAFNTTLQTIPPVGSWIVPDADQRRRWRERLDAIRPADHRKFVGLVWSGSAGFAQNRLRSTTLNQFAPLAKLAGYTFISLQKGPPAEQASNPPAGMKLIDWTGELNDFADTAALISELDLVITTDTAVAHLSATLGKPTNILLMYSADFRWLRDRQDNSWYPTVKLFRQPTSGDWDSPVGEIVNSEC